MKRIVKQDKRKKINIVYIYNQKGKNLKEILKEGCLDHLKGLVKNHSFKL